MVKLSDYVFQLLAEHGVKDVFMLSGGGCMHLVNSVGRNPDIIYTCCLFEQVVAVAADAYAQYTNDIGVGLVTTGPGGTNAITGVAAAWTDSIPLFMISGQVKTSDISGGRVRTLGFQELDIVSVVKPITKYAVTVLDPTQIAYEVEKCIDIAKSGRPGPVWLDIPLDVQAAMIDEKSLKHYIPEKKNTSVITTQVEETIELLRQAERPVILAGYGVKLSKSEKIFKTLLDKTELPVLLTWKAMDLLDDEDPLFFGRPGGIGQRAANFIQQNADLIISIGARLDFGQIGYDHGNFAPNAKKVIIDIDKAELEKFSFATDISICCSAAVFIKEMLERLPESYKADYKEWKSYCNRLKRKYPPITDMNCKTEKGTSTYLLMELLAKYTDEDTVFAPGNSGACSEIFCQAYAVQKGQRVVTTNTLGSMGTGLPESIGACIAGGKKTTICVNGDGGFQMNIQDLETVHRLQLPIKYFILNNAGYGSIRNSQDNYFDGFYVGAEAGSGVTLPDMERIAYAYKLPYFKITDNMEMEEILQQVLNIEGPVICEMMVSPEEKTLPRTKSVVTENGSMESKPFEDLFPFLPRDEFEENMFVRNKGECYE